MSSKPSEKEKLYYAVIGLTNYYRVGVYAEDVTDARIKTAVKVKRGYEDMMPLNKRPEVTYIKQETKPRTNRNGGRPCKNKMEQEKQNE